MGNARVPAAAPAARDVFRKSRRVLAMLPTSFGRLESGATTRDPRRLTAAVYRGLRPSSRCKLGLMTPAPTTVSLIQHRLEAIVQEMGEAMLRTAYSQILNSSRDFSTAVFDAEGRLAARAEHVPIHVGALPWAVASVADFFKGRIAPGDLFLLNDPYHGNNHLPDLTVLLPVFVGDRPVFWSINR